MYGDGFGFGGIEFPLRRPTMERKDRGGMIASEYERERESHCCFFSLVLSAVASLALCIKNTLFSGAHYVITARALSAYLHSTKSN